MNKKEIFLIEYQGKNIVFVPLKGLILEIHESEKNKVNELLKCSDFSFEKLLDLFPEIEEDRLISQKIEEEKTEQLNDFHPTSVILFPTFNCHLRCIYCYSEGGKHKVNMDWDIAKSAMDFVIRNAKQKEEKECFLEFHGGGEPTWNWSVFQSSLSYFCKETQKEGLIPRVNLVTNGMLSEKQVNWMVEHDLRAIQISLDGMEEIQNFQRPTAKGGESFATVFRAIKYFLERDAEIAIHSVITEIRVQRIPEILRFFGENFPGSTVQIEPASPCGRGLATGQQFPSPDLFVRGFIEALSIAKSFDIDLIYSGVSSRLTEIHRTFCGVYEPNFVVTPEGLVTACHEVAELDHPFADFFIYGYWGKKELSINHQKIRQLRNFAVENNSLCDNCFARFYCAGDCLIKRLTNRADKKDLSFDSRCRINRELAKYYIFNHLFGEEKGGAP